MNTEQKVSLPESLEEASMKKEKEKERERIVGIIDRMIDSENYDMVRRKLIEIVERITSDNQ